MSKSVFLDAYSDDCSYVKVDGEEVSFSEYTSKSLTITTPSGDIISISFGPMSGTSLSIPDGSIIELTEDGYWSEVIDGKDVEWQGEKVTYQETSSF